MQRRTRVAAAYRMLHLGSQAIHWRFSKKQAKQQQKQLASAVNCPH